MKFAWTVLWSIIAIPFVLGLLLCAYMAGGYAEFLHIGRGVGLSSIFRD